MRINARKYMGLLVLSGSLLLWNGCGRDSDAESLQLEEVENTKEDVSDTTKEKNSGTEDSPENTKPAIIVHVCGCVNAPGVYELPEGSRIYEAVEAAGGMGESAAADFLNQAAVVEDGQQIYIPSGEEVSGQAWEPADPAGTADDGKINLNTAGEEELMSLSGIGEAKAAAIIRYRQEKGGFSSIEELMEVDGIKEGVFEKIKDQVKV